LGESTAALATLSAYSVDHQYRGGDVVISTDDLDVLVSTEWITDHLDDAAVRLVEVDVSPANYNQGHLPGAVLWNAYSDLRDVDYRPISRTDFQQLLSRSGIDQDTTVVFYGYGALLGFWLMKAYGHRDVRMLNASREAWEKDGGGWSSDIPTPMATSYELPAEDKHLLASRDDVTAAMDDGASVVLDVRSVAEYRGERFWPSGATEGAGRAGHIPNAVNVPIDLVRDASGAVKDTDELRRLYTEAGISPDQRVITYCTIGNRASLAWFVLKYLLGYPNVAVYQGSYVEWGKLPDTPIEPG
jgi:thiosulfate/3-mercaptopyruvate sulfurtransferase